MSPTRAEKLAAMYRRDAEWRDTPRGRALSSSRPVSPRSRVFGRLILGAMGAGLALAVVSFPIQALPRARVGIAGYVEGEAPARVTLTASLPPGYGLTSSEERAGWPALNQAGDLRVPLRDHFTAAFPPAHYCVTRPLWMPLPAPPASFVLRFSDAPSEEYRVWSSGRRSGYVVLADGVEVPPEMAAWKLDLGSFERVSAGPPSTEESATPSSGQGARAPLWLLRVRFERRPSPATAEERLS